MFRLEARAWTVREMMRFAIDLLQKQGIDEARLNVELLLAHALQSPRIHLYADTGRTLTRREIRDFRRLLERRLNREPVQYIVGSTSFMGLLLRVDQRVLIPRPETETLVEQVMIRCNEREGAGTLRILEVGTGSGNIAIALAKFLRNVSVTSFDISEEALEVARLNAAVQEVQDRIDFRCLDVFDAVDQLLGRGFDVLVSNPPYVSEEEWKQLPMEIRRYEPASATSDSGDGYAFYRRLTELAPLVLRDDGLIALEIGYRQAVGVTALVDAAGFADTTVIRDLGGIERVVLAHRGPSRLPPPNFN